MKRHLLVLLWGAALACASPSSHLQATARDPAERSTQQQIADALAKGHAPDEIRVCEYEEVLGTRIRQVSCRNLDEQEQERAAAQRQMLQLQQQNSQRMN
jgi:hypothetical protein